MTTSLEMLAAQIERLRRQVAALQSGSQLANSSIDNGQLLVTQNDGSGNQQVTTIVGTQYDGTSGAVVVAGPTPPVPGEPFMITAIGGVKVQWHGNFTDPQPGFTSPVVAPQDFAGVDIHVSDDPSFPEVGFVGTNHGTIISAAGGEVFVSWPTSGTPLYARLVTRSKAGKFSNPGLTAGPVTSGQVQLGDLGFNITQFGGGTTIYYTVAPDTPVAPSWGFSIGDLWLQETGATSGVVGGQPAGTPIYQTSRWLGAHWGLLQDQGISNSLAAAILAQSMAAAKAQLFTQPDMPIWSGAAGTAYWIDNDNGNVANVWDGAEWVPFQLGNGAIQPNSLIASNVIATGTVTAALLEASMVLATTIIAGVVKGDHATMTSDGFHVWRAITGEGVVEVGRLATGSGNFLGIADSNGMQVATIADDGTASFTGLNVSGDPVFGGTPLSESLLSIPGGGGAGSAQPGARNWIGWDGTAQINSVTSEVGLIEMAVTVETGRIYWIVPSFYWQASTSTFLTVTVRDGGAGTPTITSPIIEQCFFDSASTPANFQLAERHRAQRFVTGGTHRLLLTVAAGGGGSINVVTTGAGQAPTLQVVDLGPDFGNPATTNRGGGGTPAPLQQTYTGNIAPSGSWSYRGNGTLRTDTTDVVQGWDPSGYNGDGHGGWNFTIPNISGSVDRVDLYLYNNWSFFNSGGQALIGVVTSANTSSPTVLNAVHNYGFTYPKSGPITTTLLSSWYPSFNGKTSIGIYVGPSGGTNETFYIRPDGPGARLRIWYTQ